MNHIPYEKWLLYIIDELEPKVRTSFDEHLYQCDQCLEQYMKALEKHSHIMLENEDDLTERIMDQIETSSPSGMTKHQQTNFHRKTIIHYVIAASMTLFLMVSGVFSNLTNIVDHVDEQKQKTSIIQSWVDHSTSIVDTFQKTFKEGN